MNPYTESAEIEALTVAQPVAQAESLTVDLDQLTIGDMELFDRIAVQKASNGEIVGLLNRVVVGGVNHLPYKQLPRVMEALKDALQAAGNPDSAQGN